MNRLHKPGRAARRIVSVFVFVFMLAVTAHAYTVVMRGGRRIEIPSRFIVTASTLTYETAPGIQITVQMAAIDIPATEKANNELAGSLLRRGQLTPESSRPSESGGEAGQIAQAAPARRTITNRDLESTMRRRRESELAYESRRKQLGLPSVEESRKQAAASDAIGIELEQQRVAEKESENYWRGRAAAFRAEMAALDGEIAWIRARLDEGPFAMSSGWSNGWGNGSFTSVTSVIPLAPFGNFGRRSFGNFGVAGFPRPGVPRPNVFVAPRQVAFGGVATRGHVLVNPGAFPHARPPAMGSGFPVFPGVGVFGSTFPGYDYSYERSALITHFNELAAARAALNARWRELEEEARRAGAPPGWLRP